MMWIKNSAGQKDAMLTFATISFFSCLATVLLPMLNGFQIPWTKYIVNITQPDTALVLGFLGATFTSYVVRRNKKDQIESEEVQLTLKGKSSE